MGAWDLTYDCKATIFADVRSGASITNCSTDVKILSVTVIVLIVFGELCEIEIA